jgi:hypothetical protein
MTRKYPIVFFWGNRTPSPPPCGIWLSEGRKRTKSTVDYIRNMEMPEELQEKWGYKPITEETKAKILGLNLARLAKIEPTKRVKKAA